MIFKKWLIQLVRTILKMHIAIHIFEGIAAISEGAFVTLGIILVSTFAQILAVVLIPNEHVHVTGSWNGFTHSHRKRHKH